MAKFTITVTATLNGKSCKNPQIEFIQGEGYIYPCEIKDGVITIEILPGAPANACIEGYIKCDDTCLNCPPQYFKKCLCNDVTVLTVCQKCVDGFIVEICTPEQLAQGMICTPDGCKCPPDKPVKDPNTGQCVQCITGTTQGCKVCIGGSWVIIDCGPNEVCKDGKCECAPGYVRDPFTGECVPPPQCSDDEDCGICETCVNGVCVPVVCPPNHRCIDGICVYWPCTSVTCNNGADCGEDCGCLNGECVPCHLLNCRLDASCQSALGCRCNALGLCEPVPDCGQYCDGETPCLDTNCTCYNNRCVDCSRFPCPEDCATHYNCGCNAEGECDGGKACTDTLTLKKEEVCSNDGCQLVADYTTENKCMCDPIEFRISNTRDCTGEVAGTALVLKTEIFKNNLPYKDYKSIVGMGDDEEVSGTITTHIDFFTKNSNGLWVPETVTNAPVANVAIVDNKIDLINITAPNLGFLAPNSVITANRKVVITLRATGVEIPNNDCKKYNSAVIATYEIDLTAPTIYCPVINSFKTIKSTFLKDTVSTRRPLFVWSKSTTGTFANTKFVTNGVYAQSGWFRKEYGNLIAGKWQDKINNPKRGAENQFNELWNNYNYKVKVDCGCKSNDATLQKVVFCCPKEFDYTIPDCGRTITIPPFDTCSVNKYLGGLFNQDYIIPAESQTYYWMIINGTTEVSLKPSGGNLTTPFTYPHSEPITSVAFEQRYTGNPLVATACPVSYVETPVLPEFSFTVACNPAVIEVLKSANPSVTEVKIEKVSGIGFPTTDLTLSSQSTKFTSVTEPINSPYNTPGSFKITAKFSNGCMNTKTFDIAPTCGQEVVIVATPTVVAKSGCIGGGSDPDIQATATGFGADVQYSINGGVYQSSPVFLDNGPGKYVVTAKGTVNGIAGEVFAVSNEIEIVAAKQPIMTSTSLCGNNTGIVTISNGSPGSTFSVTKDGVPLPSPAVLNASGSWILTIPSNGAGVYAATLVTDPSGLGCNPVTLSTTVEAGGQTVAPTIIIDPTGCQGGVMHFTITDGGLNRTYNLSATGGNLGSPTATANGGFPLLYTFTPTATSGVSITIASSTNNCDILVPHTTNVVGVDAGPTKVYVTGRCSTDTGPDRYVVTVVTEGVVTNVTSVEQDGITAVSAILISPNTWEFADFYADSDHLYRTYTALNSGTSCSKTVGFTLEPCFPDVGSITISSNSPTCGQMNTTVNVTSVDFGYIENEFFQWYQVIGGLDVAIGTPGIITGGNVPPLTVFSTNSQLEYKVKIFKANGSTAESNVVGVVAGNTFTPVINGPSTASTGILTQYSASPMADSYLWTLSNSTVTNQVIGTESSVGVVFATPDNNVISLTSTTALCGSASTSIPVVSTSDCSSMSVTITVPGPCDPNIFATVNTGDTGATVVSQTWTGTGITPYTYVGAALISRSLSDLTTGQTVPDLTVSVTFSNGCVRTNSISYQRCTCYCTGTVCNISNTITSDTNIVVAETKFPYGIDGTIFITDPIPIVYVDGDPLPGGTVINAGALPWDATNGPLNNSRLNLSSVYNSTGKLSFRTVATGNAVAVGFAADNGGTLTIDGDLIFSISDLSQDGNNTPFKKWWVIDYAVTAGDCIEYTAENLGIVSSANPFAVGFETYSVDIATLDGLASVAAVNAVVVDSARTLSVTPGDTIAYGCPDGSSPTAGCTPTCNCPTYPN